MQKILVPIAALIVLTGGAYLIWSKAPRLEDVQMASSTPAGVEMKVVDVNEETDSYSIEVKYPQFGIPSVDARVKDYVDTAIAAFKSYPADVPSVDSVPKNEQLISFSKIYTGGDYISVALLISEYTGGAHPNSVYIGVNTDVRTGSEVALSDALALIGKSLEDVASETHAHLSAKLGEAFFEEGAQAKTENYSTFVVGKDEVTFIFNSYQVAPYAAGAQDISFARIK